MDLPAQIENLARHAELECVRERIDTVAIDWLTDAPLTGTEEADLYWMSQFLDCFSLDEVRSILLRTARAMKAGAKLAVLEPLVDEQRHEAAALSLAATSLYFTVMGELEEGSIVAELYGTTHVTERHRHRYEVNVAYKDRLREGGLVISGQSPDGELTEFVELPREVHPFYVATQAHPEFKSRPTKPHPLFAGLVKAALDHQQAR